MNSPKTDPSQPCEIRVAFETSERQHHRIMLGADRKKISKAEWLRQAAETQLKRQKL